jgi:nucleoside-diphosphate-sugar epimerase
LTKLLSQFNYCFTKHNAAKSRLHHGGDGFIGGHVVAATLGAGYRVRLSIRRTEQIQKLNEVFSGFEDQLDFIVIPDFTIQDALLEAVCGVDYVVHIASPMLRQDTDFRTDFVDPAVQSTLSVLNAAKPSSSVGRGLIMSSILALIPLGAQQGLPNSVQGTEEIRPLSSPQITH